MSDRAAARPLGDREAALPALPGWGAPDDVGARRRAVAEAAIVVALPGLALGLALGALLGAPAGAVAALVYAAALWAWVRLQGRRALRALRATPLDPLLFPRAANLMGGLARDLRMAPPLLWLIPGEGANALVCRAAGRPCLALTRDLVERFTRTELEAVIAHGLVRLGGSSLGLESLSVALGGRLRRGRAIVGSETDARAAALTRYPPGLMRALAKAAPRARFGAFWFVAEGPSHEGLETRIAALADL